MPRRKKKVRRPVNSNTAPIVITEGMVRGGKRWMDRDPVFSLARKHGPEDIDGFFDEFEDLTGFDPRKHLA